MRPARYRPMVDAKTAALYAGSLFLSAVVVATPLFMSAWPDQPALFFLVLLFIPGLALFIWATYRSPDAGAAAPCQHRWQACRDGLTGRQVARCVVCGAGVPLP